MTRFSTLPLRLALVFACLASTIGWSRHDCLVPSSLESDYWLVTTEPGLEADRDWLRELAVRAGDSGAVLGQLGDGFLIRADDNSLPHLADFPGLASLTEHGGFEKLSSSLRSFRQGDEADGWHVLSASLHFGEILADVRQAIELSLPTRTDVIRQLAPTRPRSLTETRKLLIRVHSSELGETLALLAAAEAIAWVERWQAPELQSNPAITWHQAGQAIEAPFNVTHAYDQTAPLFYNGIMGVGQVIGVLDRGYGSVDNEQLRLGPNAADAPPAVQVIPPDAQPTLELDRKIIASVRSLPIEAGCSYDGDKWEMNTETHTIESDRHHGLASALIIAGDDHATLAGRAGLALDDPTDIESSKLLTDGSSFENVIDHHDFLDGMAPGAQLFLQDVLPERSQLEAWENPTGPDDPREVLISETQLPCHYNYPDIISQAYWSHEQLRVHNNSWGTQFHGNMPDPDPHYHVNCESFDRASWQLRDLTFVRSAGNISHEDTGHQVLREAQEKSTIVVGASSTPDIHMNEQNRLWGPRGPAIGGRIKPDLIGQVPLRRKPETGRLWALGSGTSETGPVIAGLTALAREYFVAGYYPGGSRGSSAGFSPTNALVKAILINSTRNLTGTNTGDQNETQGYRPSHGQGWGRPVLDDTLFFAGDHGMSGGQRSNLIVLNDVPNGTLATQLADARESIVAQYQPAIAEGEIHEYDLWVNSLEDLHVTLSWSDPPPVIVGSDRTKLPKAILRNDLDLELVSPGGTVFRPNPGLNSTDPNRLWAHGYTTISTTPGPASCVTAESPLESDLQQGEGDEFCAFLGRDEFNTTENVFLDFDALPAGSWKGRWTVRIIAFEFKGGVADPDPIVFPAWPDLVTGDEGCYVDDTGVPIDEPHDCITEQHQGYALVASGDVSSLRPQPRFGKGHYTCGEEITLEVWSADPDADPDGDELQVILLALNPGDACEGPFGGRVAARELLLERSTEPDEGHVYRLQSTEVPQVLRDCHQTLPGAYPVQDDSHLLLAYWDSERGAWAGGGTTRFTCRDVKLESVSAAPITPGSTAVVTLNLADLGAMQVSQLVGEVLPALTDGGFPSSIAMSFSPVWGHTGQFSLEVPADFDCADFSELRFRAELWEQGAFGTPVEGFRDRVWFSVPCAP
ncbi:MAG: S8 family serine peptidase [Acidobacteriota bacterium]